MQNERISYRWLRSSVRCTAWPAG